MSQAEEEVARRVRQRDTAALGEFLVACRPRLLVFIERQLGTALRRKLEPDDIYQEISAEAVRALPTTELGARDPFGWLCQLAEHRIIDAHRKFFATQKRAAAREVGLDSPADESQHAGIIDLLVASMTTASQAFSRNQREFRLLTALATLPEDQREALRLRYLEGLPSKEIAARLGKSDGAVRVMLTRSLGKLQEMLGPEASA
jgi:RNA polymerase sigma-70 factor (ECF subfamily)